MELCCSIPVEVFWKSVFIRIRIEEPIACVHMTTIHDGISARPVRSVDYVTIFSKTDNWQPPLDNLLFKIRLHVV